MYTNRHDNQVVFRTINNGVESETKSDACYRGNLAERTGYICYSNGGNADLSEDHFLEWIKQCQLNGIVAWEAIPFRENKRNCLYIPEGLYDYHGIYTSLCCFRWCNFLPQSIYQLITDNEGVAFFQRLQFMLCTSNPSPTVGHSFLPYVSTYYLSGEQYRKYISIDPYLSMTGSLAAHLIFKVRPVIERINGSPQQAAYTTYAGTTVQTSSIINVAANRIPHAADLISRTYQEILSSRWQPLFEIDTEDREILAKVCLECVNNK